MSLKCSMAEAKSILSSIIMAKSYLVNEKAN